MEDPLLKRCWYLIPTRIIRRYNISRRLTNQIVELAMMVTYDPPRPTVLIKYLVEGPPIIITYELIKLNGSRLLMCRPRASLRRRRRNNTLQILIYLSHEMINSRY